MRARAPYAHDMNRTVYDSQLVKTGKPPVPNESRAFSLAIHCHEELFASLDGHKIHVTLNEEN